MTIDSTEAKIGRLMKKWENFMCLLLGRGGSMFVCTSDGFPAGLHLCSRSHAHEPVDQHPIVRVNALADHSQVSDGRTEHNFARLNGILIVDHVHKFLSLIRAD